jgi:NADH-quinone oxidoreductase subunit C
MADAPKSGEPAAESPSAQPPDAGPPAGAGGASGASAPPQSAEAAAESSAGPPAEPSSAAAASKPAPVEPKPSAAKPAVLEKPVAAKPKPAAAKPRPKPKPKAPPEAPKGPVDPPPPEDLEKPAFLIALEAALPDRIQQISYWVGDWTVIVAPEALLEVGAFLKDSDEGSFDYCADLTATDWPPREKRFDVVYCLYSTRRRQRVRIKVQAAGGEAVPSVTGLWPAANWLEREVWDMFGVNVTGHPDLRRILMPPAWQGHPQRKDYPLEGPGELLLESPMEWLRLRNVRDEAEIE